MTILSEDGAVFVDVGDYDILNCLYSTVIVKLDDIKDDIALAISFLKNGTCTSKCCIETARELNIVRDRLSNIPVSELIYDYKNLKKKVPWINKINPIVTSCGNLFTTADGKDLIFELNTLLCYCNIKKISVIIQ